MGVFVCVPSSIVMSAQRVEINVSMMAGVCVHIT